MLEPKKYTTAQLEKAISTLTQLQIKILLRLSEKPARAGFAISKAEGPAINGLLKKGFIRRFGRFGTKTRYQVVEKIFTREYRVFLKEMAGV